MFSPDKSFFTPVSLSKRFVKFSEILQEIIFKKFQVKFLKGFSGEMFNSVRFTHEIKSSECFFDRFHTHTIFFFFINSPQIVSLSHEERKNIYIFVVILNYFPGKKRVFFHSVWHSRKQNSPENVFILDFTNRGIQFSHTWKKKNPLKILLIVFFYSVSQT